MSLSVCVLIGACSPVTTAPCVKKNVEYSVEEPDPVVGTSSETITLSPINVGIDVVEIISFDGLQTSDFALYQKYKIIPALKQVSEIEFSINIARTAAKKFPVWIQLDTGMNRLGISENELNSFFEEGSVTDMTGLDVKVVMSHLSCSDSPNHSANEKQRTRFIKMSKKFQTASLSLSASHGLLISKNFHFDILKKAVKSLAFQ